MKIRVVLLFLLSSFFIFPTVSFGQTKEILKFKPGDTLDDIRYKIEHNGYTFTVGQNWVYDMSAEEKGRFFSRRQPRFITKIDKLKKIGPLDRHLGKELPVRFDWRNCQGRSYIGPVRNQGSCGGCYAFGACAAAEGAFNYANALYDGNCSDFSESFIIWCLGRLPKYDDHFFGCEGADYDYYELEALTVEGVVNETDFPYRESDPGMCAHWSDPTAKFESWHRTPCNDIDAVKTAIMTYGVVVVAVNVINAFEGYMGGIYEDTQTSCDDSPCYYVEANHSVALVGWDDNGGDGYWILRNSWGVNWGENGYMRIKYTSARVGCAVCYLVVGLSPPLRHNLIVSKTGAGSGKVISNPAGVDCGEDCSEIYNPGINVTLTALPDAGCGFSGWSGDCSGSNIATIVHIDSDKSCVANFTPPGAMNKNPHIEILLLGDE